MRSPLAPDERTAFAQNMLAAVLGVVGCDTVLTHTGNVGVWTGLYRGSAHNLYQFDAAGALLAAPINS